MRHGEDLLLKNLVVIYVYNILFSRIGKKIIRESKISPETNELYNKICRELPSLYVNNLTRQVIEERGLLDLFRKLFKLLCKKYNEDGKLSYAAVKTHPTKFKY